MSRRLASNENINFLHELTKEWTWDRGTGYGTECVRFSLLKKKGGGILKQNDDPILFWVDLRKTNNTYISSGNWVMLFLNCRTAPTIVRMKNWTLILCSGTRKEITEEKLWRADEVLRERVVLTWAALCQCQGPQSFKPVGIATPPSPRLGQDRGMATLPFSPRAKLRTVDIWLKPECVESVHVVSSSIMTEIWDCSPMETLYRD